MNKNLDFNNPETVRNILTQFENAVGEPAFHQEVSEEFKVSIRVNETISPGMFKPDPLIPGGYIANSLTVRAMRPDIFVTGNTMDDLRTEVGCACGKECDLQFWKLCPHCGRELKT